jgi:molybdopterin-guanine dinucleotide biosynthesis protein B
MAGTKETSHMHTPRIIGFAGWSGSGKTTLITRLIPLLTARGVTVSTIKHAHHAFDVDKPGKDSYEHRSAGATEALVTSADRWALMHELRGAREPDLRELLTKLAPVDLVIVEGFKRTTPIKIEVHRSSLERPFIYPNDPAVVAVASDVPVPLPSTIPTLALDDIDAIADFVLMRAAPATQLPSSPSDYTPTRTKAATRWPAPHRSLSFIFRGIGIIDFSLMAQKLTDELTTGLARMRDSFVIARNTAFTYKGKPVDAKVIGKDLGVRYVLEGSVQPSGNSAPRTIDAQTSRGGDGAYRRNNRRLGLRRPRERPAPEDRL